MRKILQQSTHGPNVYFTLNTCFDRHHALIVVSLDIHIQYLSIYIIPKPSVFSLVCVSAAEEWHGRRFRWGSAEETPGGGGLVQPSPLPIHLHPGPGSQDPRPAATAQKLRQTHTSTKTGQALKFSVSYWIETSAKRKDGQLQKIPVNHRFLPFTSGNITPFYWHVPASFLSIVGCECHCNTKWPVLIMFD